MRFSKIEEFVINKTPIENFLSKSLELFNKKNILEFIQVKKNQNLKKNELLRTRLGLQDK